ncbi:xanthine dehydrogenase family protein subunit M [Clostridium sp. BSD9I1]|uniref:FAD binding domain-containing protein n=1 Tax=Clostridium sp. BSD9I1 TaxID=2003589 RepID=UPI00164903D8|nr:FAD binding domain-containing protein [Clostridium sp. BSD9I1]
MTMKAETPKNLKELKSLLKNIDDNTYFIAGGTDFIIKMREKGLYNINIIDVSGIEELKYIKEEDNFLKIGANTTFLEIEYSPITNKYFKCLKESAEKVGSTQIRNTATIAGNIANASPAADSIPALLSLDAKVKTINKFGQENIRELDDVVIGLEKNNLKLGEIITEILVPLKYKEYKTSFAKIGSRSTVTISKLSISVSLKYEDKIKDVKVSIGSLGPKAFRSKIAEELLEGRAFTNNLLEEFKNVLQKQVDLSIPTRQSRPYKREAIRGLAENVFRNIFE